MGDGQDAEGGALGPDLLDAPGHDLQGVDVEAGVGLVEDGQLGLEDGHLQDLVALLLAAGEPLVEVAVGEGRVHVEALHPLHDREAQLQDGQVDALAGRQGLAQEVDDRHPGDGHGVLEGQEDAGLAPDVGAPGGDVVALVEDAALGHLVLGAAEQDVGQGGLARPVGAHQGMDFAGRDLEVEAPQDLRAGRGHMEILDRQQGGRGRAHPGQCISPMAIVVFPGPFRTGISRGPGGLPSRSGSARGSRRSARRPGPCHRVRG